MTNLTDKNDYDIIFPSPVLNRGNSFNNLHINNNNQNYNNLILLSPNEDGENSSPSPNYLKKSLSSPNLISPTNKLFNYIRSKDLKSIENFMIEGGDINAKSYYGTTCLHLAVQEGNTKLVKYLLEKNSDPNIAEGVENRTPAHLAASYGFTECLRILLSHGADITVKDSKGQTPLIKACRHNHFLSVQLILDCGGSVKDKDTERGFTPLHHCCSNGDLNCTKLLISFGSSINEPDKLGRSPLFIATCKSRVEVIKLLLENDADFMQKALDGKTPFSISKSNKEILNLFKKKNKMNKLKVLREIQMKEWDNKQVITWFTLQSFSKEVLSSLKKLKIKGDQLFSIDDNYLKKNVKAMSSQERADFINKRDMMLHHSDNSFSLHFLTIDYNQIKFCGHLGQGNFAEVKKGIYNGNDVAVKIIYRSAFRDKNKFQLFKQEVSILSQLEHPNILKFMGTCTTGESDYCIITEFMGGGNLRDLIKENFGILNTKGLRRQIIKNVINAMIYLHSFKPQPILHRDLTSHNLLLDKNRVCKLADFGLSRLRDDEHTMTGSVGNLPWVCPEVIMGNAYNEKADVFSFGVVLYELFTGKLPHTGFYPIKYAELVASGYRPSIENIVDPWKKIISICWSQSPEDRPHFVELMDMVDKIQTFFDNVRDEKSMKENNFSISFSHTSQDVSQFEVPDDLLDNCNQDGYIIDEKK